MHPNRKIVRTMVILLNWGGGEGQNMEADLTHEIINGNTKEFIKNLISNKTMGSMGTFVTD